MRNCTTGAAVFLALVLGVILCCDAHNTFSFKGRNRWNAGKRAEMDTNGLTDRLTQTTSSFVQQDSAATTLRQLLVDLRDYCSSLVQVLDESRIESERK